jgi:hypothetical protein
MRGNLKTNRRRFFFSGRIVWGIAFCVIGVLGQNVISNPAKPRNSDAGRVRSLTPVVTIADEGGGYYFKRPSLVQFGVDGSIYVADQEQLLRFDAQGKFVRNYFRKGQGPGELQNVSGFAVVGGTLVVHNMYPSKIVRFDPDGKILSDVPAAVTGGSLRMRGADGRNCFLIKMERSDFSQIKGKEGILDQPNPLLSIAVDGGAAKTLGTFATRMYLRKAEGGGGVVIPLGKLLLAVHEKYLAISHTDEYAVKILDVQSGVLARTITREYTRVKTPPEDQKRIAGGVMLDGKVVLAPAPPFAPDIVNLFAHGDEIWAVTSTKSGEKGVLVDVFSWEGAYLDCFYLRLPAPPDMNVELPAPQVIQGDFLAAIEKNADETYVVRKYRIGK